MFVMLMSGLNQFFSFIARFYDMPKFKKVKLINFN